MARYEPGSPIRREHLTMIAMVNGNEEHISIVVLGGRVREWVGIGWIDVTNMVAPADLSNLPRVVNEHG